MSYKFDIEDIVKTKNFKEQGEILERRRSLLNKRYYLVRLNSSYRGKIFNGPEIEFHEDELKRVLPQRFKDLIGTKIYLI